ncbi:MAG TPA: MBL fold metallo-hydrolase [Nitrososphaera sp.]|nr:MBL fold metallo-hydrolase [Nitrososphaera sp.]
MAGCRLTFYGGVDEVGGNKILLEDSGARIFLDFGKGFSRRAQFFEEYLKPRSANGLLDFIEMGLVPDISGIYRDDLLEMAGRRAGPPDVDAVLVSHAHADHVDYISFLHRDIPVYMGATCHGILKAIQERAPRDFEREVLDFVPRPSKRGAKPVARKIETFRSGRKFKVGSLEIHPIHVDHSIPGAYGFIIHTSTGAVVYTGDIRLHGARPEMTREFVQEAKVSKPVAMICEGTRIADEFHEESEAKVFSEANSLVSAHKNAPVFADFSFKDMDRLRTFYRIAVRNGRKLVVKLKDCYYLKQLSQDSNLGIPNYDDKEVVIYKPKQVSGTYADGDYYGDDAKFASMPNAKTAAEISKEPGRYLCGFGYFGFSALIDMKPPPGSLYLHSSSEPYNEEMVLSQDRVDNWLQRFGMERHQIHCSGHARSRDLFQVVKEIDSQMLFPVHSEHPEMFVRATRKMTIVEEAKVYSL